MAENLVIVESPAKCKTISKYLGKDYKVLATMGHIIDLPERELGVDIENNFEPKYTTSKGKKKIVKELKDEAKGSKNVFLATDPDREGEAIAWHVANSIVKSGANIARVQFNEITKKAVIEAIEHPHEIDENKVNAQQARRILDRIVGYQVSPVLWRTVFKGLSAGRVQSVALRIICDRENEINAFVKKEYWSVLASFVESKIPFTAKLNSIAGEKVELNDKATTEALVARIAGKPFTISDIVSSQKSRKPYPPFITSTLQQDASRKLGFSAAKSMMIAQQLYEGLELGALGTMGLITYMRTDSTRIADEALAASRKHIQDEYGDGYLPSAPRIYSSGKNAQDAHEAIRPSNISDEFTPEHLEKYLSRDQLRLYTLIWKRFIASQMSNAVFDATRVDLAIDDVVFRATGSVLKFDGFLKVYEDIKDDSKDDKSSENEGGNDSLPRLDKGMTLTSKAIDPRQHFTQPPPRYSEASLVRELEDKGIGRPSTYAQIIDTLRKRKYVEMESRRFFPTEVGLMVKDLLVREFADIFDVGFTADMESKLDAVEEGNAEWKGVLKDFYEPFLVRLEGVKKEIKNIRAQNQEVTDRMCPTCNSHNLVVKWSKNGKFLACQGFPACKYTEPLSGAEPETTDEICDKCGAPMVVLNVRGNRFLGCSKYPDCKNTKSISTGVPCPEEGCSGFLIERTTKRGKVFYGCSEYPKCSFATWDVPVKETCATCGFEVLLLRETKSRGKVKRCMKCKSEFVEEQEEEKE